MQVVCLDYFLFPVFILHLVSCTPDDGISSCSCALGFAVTHCTAQQALRAPVAPAALPYRSLPFGGARAPDKAALHVATEREREGLIGLHDLWLCRNFDVL